MYDYENECENNIEILQWQIDLITEYLDKLSSMPTLPPPKGGWKCKKHKTYQAKRQPQCLCLACWIQYLDTVETNLTEIEIINRILRIDMTKDLKTNRSGNSYPILTLK